jgi:hypothetical protein
MMQWVDAWRAGAVRAMGGVAAAVLLASCGGGDQIDPFVPARVISFGDENSLIADTSDGPRKYSVNFQAEANGPIDCTQFAIWNQIVASSYSLPFPECPGTATSTPSRILATPNATVQDVATQIEGFLASDSFGRDFVTVLAGTHDILALQQQIGTAGYTLTDALRDAGQRGADLAAQVNRIAEAGGKVLVSTVPSVGFTPQGRADAAKMDQLNQLSTEFNTQLRIGLVNDGRRIGLVLTDERIRQHVANGSLNTTDSACNDETLGDVLTCTSQTLRTKDGQTASPTTWLWADDLHMSPAGHSIAGSLALERARGNPF